MTVVTEFNQFLVQRKAEQMNMQPLFLYLSVGGDEHPLMLSAFNLLQNKLNTNASNITWYNEVNQGLTHSTNPVHSVKPALDFYNSQLD